MSVLVVVIHFRVGFSFGYQSICMNADLSHAVEAGDLETIKKILAEVTANFYEHVYDVYS